MTIFSESPYSCNHCHSHAERALQVLQVRQGAVALSYEKYENTWRSRSIHAGWIAATRGCRTQLTCSIVFNSGAISLQGPHHVAQKSTKTGTSACRTSVEGSSIGKCKEIEYVMLTDRKSTDQTCNTSFSNVSSITSNKPLVICELLLALCLPAQRNDVADRLCEPRKTCLLVSATVLQFPVLLVLAWQEG